MRKLWRDTRDATALRCGALLLVLAVSALPVQGRAQADSVLVLGDSILDWFDGTGASVPEQLEEQLGLPVENRAVGGAVFAARGPMDRLLGRDIRGQLPGGAWRAVVLDGGGNDLAQHCGCQACDAVLDALVTTDGRAGAIPDFVTRLRGRAEAVFWLGYYDVPTVGGPFGPCRADLAELETRLARMADGLAWVHYVDGGAVYDPDDLTLYDADLLHPSRKGALRLAAHLADRMRAVLAQRSQ